MAPAKPAVVFDNVSLRLGGNQILHDLTFSIAPGSICGLLAPSGGGKTTVLRLILGIYAPTAGRVLVLDSQPAHFTLEERRQIGYVPQSFVLYPELSVASNLHFVAGLYGLSHRERSRRITDVIQTVDLGEARDRPASKLSGGMQRRLQLAAALLHGPRVLVIDEPTAGIDPLLRARFWQNFRNLRDAGHTLVITTQYVSEAEYCDQAVVLKEGRLVASGSPDSLYEQAFGPGRFGEHGPPRSFEAVFLKLVDGLDIEGGR